MPKRKKKVEVSDAKDFILTMIDLANASMEKLTGKDIPSWLREYQTQPKELPPGAKAASPQSAMPLPDAYAILGLPQTATLEEVEKNYKHLAAVFHPDKGGYEEAMKLLNNAYQRVTPFQLRNRTPVSR